jgi:hypothetical protein
VSICPLRKRQKKESLEGSIHSPLSAELLTNNTASKGQWVLIRIPSIPTQTRVSVIQIPISVAQIPNSVTQIPNCDAQIPNCDAQIPISVTQIGISVIQIPISVTQIGISVTQIPICVAQIPISVTQIGICDTQIPICVAQIPISVTQIGICVIQIPISDTQTHNRTIVIKQITMNIYWCSKHLTNMYEKGEVSMANYLPSSDHNLLSFSQVFITYTTTKAVSWEIVAAIVTALTAKVTAFQDALTVTDGPHTIVDTTRKNNAKKELETAMRDFINEYIRYNHIVTDEDRRALGMKIPDKRRTPVPIPTGIVEFFIRVLAIARLAVIYQDSGAQNRAKPYGVQGAEIRVGITEIGDPPITDPEKLTRSEFSTRTPHTLTFSAEDSGKRAYIAMRWENTRGEKGPWSPIQSAVIP